MPRRYKKSIPRRHRRRRRRKRPMGVNLRTTFPRYMVIPFKTADSEIVNVTTTSHIVSLRANSLADLSVAVGTVVQPMGYDQYSAIYDYYYVYSASISLHVINFDATPVEVAIHASETLVPPTSLTWTRELPYTRFMTVPGSAGGGVNRRALKMRMATRKLFGKATKDEEDFSASGTDDPLKPWFYHLQVYNAAGAALLHYTMDYTVIQRAKLYSVRKVVES